MDDMRNGFSLSSLPVNNDGPIPTPPTSSYSRRDIPKSLAEAQLNSGILTLHREKHQVNIKDLEVLEELSHGNFGTVYRCKWQDNVMAVKIMQLSADASVMDKILMDLEVIRLSSCPYIVEFYGYFISETDLKICMERLAICFDRLMKKIQQPIPEAVLGVMSVSVVNALHYLKNVHKIMHRDIKPSNILLDWSGVVKLCDFGIARRLVESRAITLTAGCFFYMPPERFDMETTSYDIRSDVWSFGITLVELATGKYPYAGQEYQIIGAIMHGELPRLKVNDGFCPELCNLVERCIQKRPTDRPNFEMLLSHPFIQMGYQPSLDEWLQDIMSMP